MDIDSRVFDFLDAIIAGDMDTAYKVALDINQGEQLNLFEVIEVIENEQNNSY